MYWIFTILFLLIRLETEASAAPIHKFTPTDYYLEGWYYINQYDRTFDNTTCIGGNIVNSTAVISSNGVRLNSCLSSQLLTTMLALDNLSVDNKYVQYRCNVGKYIVYS